MEENIVEERKKKLFLMLKKNYNLIAYLILAVIVFISIKIRTANLPGLRDISTNDWTLGPDLDPFLFLRWAKYIVENGSLFLVDNMRYVPLGYETSRELLLHPYMMAWFHNILNFLGLTSSVTYSAIIYPVFFFSITIIAFFFMVRALFEKPLGEKNANVIALVSSFFLSVFPVLLPRTIAGIPEKESAAFFFMFMAFYLFIKAWNSERQYGKYIFAVLAGAFTAGMAFVWGGYGYIFLVIGMACLISLVLDKLDIQKLKIYSAWLISSLVLMLPSQRYDLVSLLGSATIAPSIFILLSSLILILIEKPEIKRRLKLRKLNLPVNLKAILISIIIGLVGLLTIAPRLIMNLFYNVWYNLTEPAQSRLIQTVAENRQPFFVEWVGNFGPYLANIPIVFWVSILGAIAMFYFAISRFKIRERIILTSSFLFLLISITFSRYSGDSLFNGQNGISIVLLILGPIIFVYLLLASYYKAYKKEELSKFEKINFEFIFILAFLVIGIISARAAVRLVMILAIPVSILIGYLLVQLFNLALKNKKNRNIIGAVLLAVLALASYSGFVYYSVSSTTAENFTPGVYNYQWQNAMNWVRENTPNHAVFGHWWDYGYWIQSIGERATILDGGNSLSYWNHMMGRYSLTGIESKKAAEFLFAHNGTHFLIDSTDIGKYSAYSYIGSDPSLDRRSHISSFFMDESQTRESKNSIVLLYRGSSGIDEDILYESNGTKIFLPANVAGLGGIIIEKSIEGEIISPPSGLFVYNGKQYSIPIRYAFHNGRLMDFETGINSSIFIYPYASDGPSGLNLNSEGALLYLSGRTFDSQIARLYLYGEEDEYFSLAHKEDDFLVLQIKSDYPGYNEDFIYYGGFRGPIKIWSLSYSGIQYNESYIETEYPENLQYTR